MKYMNHGKAPNGATHHRPGGTYQWFMLSTDRIWHFWNGRDWVGIELPQNANSLGFIALHRIGNEQYMNADAMLEARK